MKIVQIINQLQGGGAERLVIQLHESFLEAGHQSYIISLLDIPEQYKCGRIFCLGAKSPWHPYLYFKIRNLILQLDVGSRIDIVHSHLTQSQFWAACIQFSIKSKFCLITTEHDTWNQRRASTMGALFDRFLYNPYDQIISISDGVHQSFIRWFPNAEKKSVVVLNGIELNAFYKKKPIQKKEKMRIISIGRLLPKKNFDTAIRACLLLKNKNYEYHIYGEGSSYQELKDLISNLGLEMQVDLKGHSNKIPDILAQADLFLLSSKWEGFGLVVAEAMASELPCIVSNIEGVSEVAGTNDESALLVNPKDPAEIARALDRLMEDERLRERIAKNGFEQSKKFCIHKMSQNYLKVYQSFLNPKDLFEDGEIPQ